MNTGNLFLSIVYDKIPIYCPLVWAIWWHQPVWTYYVWRSIKRGLSKTISAGKLTAIVTYNTCYTHSNGEPVFITFFLDATVSVNAIIELSTLIAWKNILDLDENKAFSKTMQLWFPFSFLDASPVLPVYSSYFSASGLVRPNQQTPPVK